MERRDFYRWRPWMSYLLAAICLVVAIGSFVSTVAWPLGVVATIGTLAFATSAHR